MKEKGKGKEREEPSRIRIPKKSGERVFEADSLMFSSILACLAAPQLTCFRKAREGPCEAVENRIARSKST